MKRVVLSLATLVAGMTLGLLVGQQGISIRRPYRPMQTVTAGPTLEAVQSLASLVTTKVTVSDVQLTRLQGYTGAAKAALLVRGDFTIGTDLTQARLIDVDPAARSAVLILRQPAPDRPRVDLSRSRLVALGTEGLWDLVPGQEAETVVVGDAYRQAQELLDQASHDPAWTAQSKKQAERVVETFMRTFAWTVEVRWEGE